MIHLLSMRGISKGFAGVQALDDVSFTVRAGEIHALMGENGAGKSTLIKVLTGVYSRDAGSITFDGKLFSPGSPRDAQLGGVSTVYQEVNLVPGLSVAENICLGRTTMRLGFLQWGAMRKRATVALAQLGVNIDVTRPLSSYSIAIQQMVAIARALDIKTKLLVLDEPTSSLDEQEVMQLFAAMRKLKSQGLGIVFVTHFLKQVYEVTDRITVLRNGRLVGEYETAALPRLELISRMLGKEVSELQSAEREKCTFPPETVPFLSARGVGRKGAIAPFDLNVHPGEVVGLAGLLGSGRTETARLLFGIDAAQTGEIQLDSKPVVLNSPRKAIASGFGFSSEDRKVEGIVADLSVRENMILALQARRGILRRISFAEQKRIADEYIKSLNIATPDSEKPIGQLSGGNQQKVLLARWLATSPRFLILDEPTRGIDIGAKAEIEKLINTLCAQGMAILLISSELEEVVRSSHRVVVLRDRAKIAELTGENISEERILQTIAEHDDVAGGAAA